MAKYGSGSGQSGTGKIGAKNYPEDEDLVGSHMTTTEDNAQEVANKASAESKGSGGGDSDD